MPTEKVLSKIQYFPAMACADKKTLLEHFAHIFTSICPADKVPIEIDLAKLPQGTRTLYVKDLKLEEKGVTVTTTADSQLFHIGEYTKAEEEDEKRRRNTGQIKL